MRADASDSAVASTMLLFRAHRDTPLVRQRHAFLQRTAGMPVVCVVDETGGTAALADLPRIGIGHDENRRLGLRSEEDAGWRCGDYGFYTARARFPDVKWFWMIEYDVLLSFARASDFFRKFDGCDDVDFLTSWFGSGARWSWGATMDERDGPICRCFFPVIRLSARAIDLLLERRQAASADPAMHDRRWPNDEVFVATSLVRAGFKVVDMNSIARVYHRTTFNFTLPRSTGACEGRIRNRLLHPVINTEELSAKTVSTRPRSPFHYLIRYLRLVAGIR